MEQGCGECVFSAAEKGKIRVVIENEPGEDVMPVAHAHWIKGTFADRTCSNCDFSLCVPDSIIPKLAYCPHCGAKMDGG